MQVCMQQIQMTVVRVIVSISSTSSSTTNTQEAMHMLQIYRTYRRGPRSASGTLRLSKGCFKEITCSSQFMEDIAPQSNRSIHRVTGLRELTTR